MMLLCLYSLYCVGSSFSACIEACKRNIKFNGASALSKIEPHLTDARVYMLTHPKEFDVVSLSLLVVTRISL